MDSSSKIIFLDFDGPLTNSRTALCYGGMFHFDPISIGGIGNICEVAEAKIVCTSIRARADSHYKTLALFKEAGLNPRHLHDDWSSQTMRNTRESQIETWLARHPEVTHYAIIDDDTVNLPNFIRVDVYDGILRNNFEKIAKCLDIDLIDAFRCAEKKIEHDNSELMQLFWGKPKQLHIEFGLEEKKKNERILECKRSLT